MIRFWKFRNRLLTGILSIASLPLVAVVPLHTEQGSPYDLKITGGLAGVPAGETRFVHWADLTALPSEELHLDGEFVPGPQALTVVFVDKLWESLPVAPASDVLFAWCTDGYFSIYTSDYIAANRPFVVLKINGDGPDKWPPAGLKFNPGPYVISVADEVVPGVEEILDSGHKRPWGVDTIRFDRQEIALAPAHRGKWEHLSARAEAGREIWMNSCASCHEGPDSLIGGNKSKRPFPILAAHAEYNVGYFRQYVRDPKSLVPSATMEPHPHYTDSELDQLIAFITAEPESLAATAAKANSSDHLSSRR